MHPGVLIIHLLRGPQGDLTEGVLVRPPQLGSQSSQPVLVTRDGPGPSEHILMLTTSLMDERASSQAYSPMDEVDQHDAEYSLMCTSTSMLILLHIWHLLPNGPAEHLHTFDMVRDAIV